MGVGKVWGGEVWGNDKSRTQNVKKKSNGSRSGIMANETELACHMIPVVLNELIYELI